MCANFATLFPHPHIGQGGSRYAGHLEPGARVHSHGHRGISRLERDAGGGGADDGARDRVGQAAPRADPARIIHHTALSVHTTLNLHVALGTKTIRDVAKQIAHATLANNGCLERIGRGIRLAP